MTPQLALAVDVGGTKIEAALVCADGVLVPGSRSRRPTGPALTPAEFGAAVEGCVVEALAAAGAGSVVGAGIGSAGPLDLAEGRIRPKNLPLLHGFALRAVVERLLPGRPVALRLDGTCIALAEHWVGANRGAASSVSLVVSTGVGGGVVLDGRAVAGRSGNAGHIGQIHVGDADPEEGSDGTLESIASGPSSVAWARRRGFAGATGEDLARAAAAGDPVALAAVARSAGAVGTAIADVATLLDVRDFAVGGGFSAVTASYLDLVRQAACERAVFDYARGLSIRASGLGGAGPLIGAAALVHLPSLLGGSAERAGLDGSAPGGGEGLDTPASGGLLDQHAAHASELHADRVAGAAGVSRSTPAETAAAEHPPHADDERPPHADRVAGAAGVSRSPRTHSRPGSR
ncbi:MULTISPECIES: ROK family protein [unclassified Rathayibacter]|uniref:ROK family protein n=1 Tax=unclassified Rathayibacter TaxID=2609250 RepID=UPI001FB4D9FB|nr:MULTISPECIES: ROK family protein [unclassified Rathayibacter]MCJ1673661.1 ROK family protein [Rathayibacter sp. VKM Ac-2929]MCJ1683345.1 ROK family protein [Rathayibacter sp. VKM Ac-2928]